MNSPILTVSQIEERAVTANPDAEAFKEQLWFYLCYNKKAVKSLAKELNVYPTLGNVNQGLLDYFFAHVGMN
jgi:hypothetical protein